MKKKDLKISGKDSRRMVSNNDHFGTKYQTTVYRVSVRVCVRVIKV